jgi:hypothetical protein
MVTTESLIRKGYFPKELIPPFKTETLANSLPSLRQSIPEIKDKLKEQKTSKCCLYSIPRVKHLRRQLSIPNPLHQIKLCETLESNWDEIESFISGSSLSCSKPIYKPESNRALTRTYEFDELKAESILRSINSRIYLKTDLSRYYSTIYTHSISWALYTKKEAKRRKNENLLCGNQLDLCIRNTQDGQTLGIPIGPDSSLIIAEIIGAALDKELERECSNLQGYRYVDDFLLFFTNYSDAEKTLSKLQAIIRNFELDINPVKTEIAELPQNKDNLWFSDLQPFIFSQKKEDQKKDLLNYFEKAFNYSKKYPTDYVLWYALSNISKLLVKKENWTLYEALILKSIIFEPSVFPIATEILIAYNEKEYQLDKQKISSTIEEIIKYHSQRGDSYEIFWALWLSQCLNISINVEDQISDCDDSVVALTALDLKNKGLISNLDTSKWESFMNPEELYSDHWLLAYEANVKNWLSAPSGNDYVSTDKFFSLLKTNHVEFYDPSARTTPIELKEEHLSGEINIITGTPGYWSRSRV